VGLVLAGAAIVGGWIAWSPAGPDSYFDGLSTGYTENGVAVLAQQPRQDLLAEGDRACAWLERQPVADAPAATDGVSGDDPFSPPTMYWRYIAETKNDPLVHVDDDSRVVIPMVAWVHLCPGLSDRFHLLAAETDNGSTTFANIRR